MKQVPETAWNCKILQLRAAQSFTSPAPQLFHRSLAHLLDHKISQVPHSNLTREVCTYMNTWPYLAWETLDTLCCKADALSVHSKLFASPHIGRSRSIWYMDDESLVSPGLGKYVSQGFQMRIIAVHYAPIVASWQSLFHCRPRETPPTTMAWRRDQWSHPLDLAPA